MDYGAIKLADSAFPWQEGANTYIAAHRLGWPGTASYHQFYNLPMLGIGDVIYLGDVNGTTYTYRVSGFKEIAPNETWVTGPQAGRDMISLQTCIENYGDYWTMGPNWYVRYVVQADRVSVDGRQVEVQHATPFGLRLSARRLTAPCRTLRAGRALACQLVASYFRSPRPADVETFHLGSMGIHLRLS